MHRHATRFYDFGRFRVDTADFRLFRDGVEVHLPQKVFETLLVLLEKPGQLVGKDELMERVWPGTFVGEDALTQKISLLRKALGDGNGSEPYIATVPKLGYRFTGVVVCPVPEKTGAATGQSEPNLPHAPGTIQTVKKWNYWLIGGAALGFVVLGLGVIWLALRHSPEWAEDFRIRELNVPTFMQFGVMSLDGKSLAYVSDDRGKYSIWVRQIGASGRGLQVVSTIEGVVYGLSFSPDEEFLYYAIGAGEPQSGVLYRINPLGGMAQKVIDGIDGPAEFDPSGQHIVFKHFVSAGGAVAGSELIIARANGSEPRQIARSEGPVREFNGYHWSSDDKIMYAARIQKQVGFDWYVAEIPTNGGKEKRVIGPQSIEIQSAQRLNRSEILTIAYESRSAPPQVFIFNENGEKRRVTNDTNRYSSLSLAPGVHRMLVNRTDIESSLWVADANQTRAGPAFTTEPSELNIPEGHFSHAGFTPEGNIVYSASSELGKMDLWWIGSDGIAPRRLTSNGAYNNDDFVSGDGKFVVFTSRSKGTAHIWRVNIDGSNEQEITAGTEDENPQVSPDGKWVVYNAQTAGQWNVWKVPSLGGVPIRIADSVRLPAHVAPVISADGKSVAIEHLSPVNHRQRWAIVSFEDGKLRTELDMPEHCYSVSWSRDGKSLVYLPQPGTPQSLWSQPIKGGAPTKLMDLGPGDYYRFDWSQDGRRILFLRRTDKHDLVLIEEAK